MNSLKPKFGIIAIFDILGYQNILINNDIEKVANLVTEIINELPNNVNQTIFSALKSEGLTGRYCKIAMVSLSWTIFSDTIFASLELNNDDTNPDLIRYIMFLASCLALQRNSFDAGLPLRGGISIGNYASNSTSYIGKPIVEAYKISQKIEMSGIIICEKAEKYIDKILLNDDVKESLDPILMKYLIPFKNNENKRYYTLKWGYSDGKLTPKILSSFREYVISRFLAHSKEITSDVFDKVNNTEIYLQYVNQVFSINDK